jgi:hypothetical protein
MPDTRVEQTTSEPGAVVSDEPLRRDADGQPVYAEWDETWSVPVEDDAPGGGEIVRYEDNEIELATPAQIRADVQRKWDDFRVRAISQHFDRDSLLDGVEKVYSTSKAAAFFGRSNQWMYWGLRNGIFTYKDGTPILPERIGKGGRRRFTLPIIREIALSCYRRGNISEEELQDIMAKILLAEFGDKAFAPT